MKVVSLSCDFHFVFPLRLRKESDSDSRPQWKNSKWRSSRSLTLIDVYEFTRLYWEIRHSHSCIQVLHDCCRPDVGSFGLEILSPNRRNQCPVHVCEHVSNIGGLSRRPTCGGRSRLSSESIITILAISRIKSRLCQRMGKGGGQKVDFMWAKDVKVWMFYSSTSSFDASPSGGS